MEKETKKDKKLQSYYIDCDVLRDFDIGPGSDLKEFTQNVGIFSQTIWMYIWLFICIVVTAFNMKQILTKS